MGRYHVNMLRPFALKIVVANEFYFILFYFISLQLHCSLYNDYRRNLIITMDLIKFSDALNELISNYPPQDAKYYLAPLNIFDVFSDIKKI